MSTSKTEIANKALTLLGSLPITNIEEDTQEARVVNRVYKLSLKSILSSCMWGFATVRKLLTEADVDLAWQTAEESYIYVKPTDIVRIFEKNYRNALMRVEKDYIISDTSGLGIKYVAYIEDTNYYSASFVEAFADKLASDIAYQILNSQTLAQQMLEKYQGISLPDAQAENAQEGTQQQILDDEWVNSRYGVSERDAGTGIYY